MATDFTSAITSWYQAVQFRDPPAADLVRYLSALQLGTLTQAQVQSAIEADPFTLNVVDPVIREYQAAFGRVPDQAGLKYWVGVVAANPNALATLATTFAASPEFQAAFGVTSPNQPVNYTTVFDMYLNVLGRVPDPVGLDFWMKSGLTAAQMLTVFAQSPEFIGNTSGTIGTFLDLEIAGTPATTGSLFQVHAPPPPSAPSGISAASYDLTPGTDTVVGGAVYNVYNAIVDNAAGLAASGRAQTLTVGDTITGVPGGINILNVADDGLGSYTGATTALLGAAGITGITTLNISSLEGIGASYSTPLNLTGWTTLTDANITASSGNDYVTVGDGTSLTLHNSNDDDIYTFGGKTVSIYNNPTPGSYGNYVEVQGGATTTTVSVTNGYDEENYIYDLHHGSGTANTIRTVNITNQVDYDTYMYSDALTQLNITGITYHYVYDYAAAGARTLNVTLNNDGNAAAYSSDYWYLESDNATSLVFNTTGTATTNFYLYTPHATSLTFSDAVDISFYHGAVANSDYLVAANATTVTINGAGAFTADMSGINSAAAINASGATGVVTVELGGTQAFTAGSGQNIVTVNANGSSLANIVSLTGLHNAATDTIKFADAASVTAGHIVTVTAANVTTSGGSTASFADWVAAAVGRNGTVAQTAHGLYDFQFGGNTYVVETAAATDAGTIAAGDTVVKLVGIGYTFASSTATAGVLHLLG